MIFYPLRTVSKMWDLDTGHGTRDHGFFCGGGSIHHLQTLSGVVLVQEVEEISLDYMVDIN